MKFRMVHLLLAVSLFTVSAAQMPSYPESFSGNDKYEKKAVEKVNKTEKEWKEILIPEQYRVLRKAATERPFSGEYYLHFDAGTYTCAACGNPLFSSAAKYDHGCGWPSFSSAVGKGSVELYDDFSFGMRRIEVRCAACGSHLGHVFDDGPASHPTRFCINSIALEFLPAGSEAQINDQDKSEPAPRDDPSHEEIATFAAGCFWGVEYNFQQLEGVISTRVGYTGGDVKNPSYRLVCTGKTGHAESVEIKFDPSQISYRDLLKQFFKLHDPTQVDRQGPDIGTQYRSVIFYHSDQQKAAAEEYIDTLTKAKVYRRPIATKVAPAEEFYEAEGYHQQYYGKKKIIRLENRL